MELNVNFLVRAIADSIWLWQRTPRLLETDPYKSIELEWFKKFRNEWGLSRALVAKEKDNTVEFRAVELLNSAIREGLFAERNPANVVVVSDRLVKANLTPVKRRQESMVSKIAFYTNPDYFVPYDTFSRDGLNSWRKRSGLKTSSVTDYSTYMNLFEPVFADLKDEIQSACMSDWVVALADTIRFPAHMLKTEGFVRKSFDLYLMLEGGYLDTADPIPSPESHQTK